MSIEERTFQVADAVSFATTLWSSQLGPTGLMDGDVAAHHVVCGSRIVLETLDVTPIGSPRRDGAVSRVFSTSEVPQE